MLHQAIKPRSINKIHAIPNSQGIWVDEDQQVRNAIMKFYQGLLGEKLVGRYSVKPEIISHRKILDNRQKDLLNYTFTVEDVKRAIFSIPKEKAPALEGYNSLFFKHYWDTIVEEVSAATVQAA